MKKMGVWESTALVVGNMIGSGILLLPSSLAPYGAISILGWLVTSTGALLLALVFARLSRIMPMTGGPYVYTHKAFGDFMGFLVAWGYWIAAWCGNAALVLSAAGYLTVFFPVLLHPAYGAVTAIGLLWIFTYLNLLGIQVVGVLQLITTIIKVIPLFLVGVVGWHFVHHSHFVPFNLSHQSNLSAIAATASLTLWAFVGVESATIPAEYIDKPKTIARATIIGTLITALVYILSTSVVLGLLSPHILEHSNAPFADAIRPLFGTTAYYLIAGIGVVTALGALNGWILIQGQIPMSAARDKLFPKFMAKLNKAHIPAHSIILSSVLISVLILLNIDKELVSLFTFIILLATTMTLLPYLLCSVALAVIHLRDAQKFSVENIRDILTLLLAGAATIYSAWALYGAGVRVLYYDLILLAIGVPIYFWMRD